MPGVARNSDICGGSIIATGYSVKVNGRAAALLGDRITGHGDCPHCGPKHRICLWFCFCSGNTCRPIW